MRLILVLVCMACVSAAQAISFPKMAKPRLDLMNPQNRPRIHKSPSHMRPEDRRRSSVFPKIEKRFLAAPYNYMMSNKPIYRMERKSLMKNPVILKEESILKNDIVEVSTKIPVIVIKQFEEKPQEIEDEGNSKVPNFNEKDSKLTPQTENKKHNVETIEQASEERNKIIGKGTKIDDYPIHNVEHIEGNSVPKSFKVNVEDTNEHRVLKEEAHKNSEEKEWLFDNNEFIFLNPVQKKEIEKIKEISEELEEYATTEYSELTSPKPYRRKRNDNIIVEENVATTVSGHRFIWRDTRLTNDLVFKNIHS